MWRGVPAQGVSLTVIPTKMPHRFMATIRQSLVAAIVAVKSGLVTPQEAQRILEDEPDDAAAAHSVRLAARRDEFGDGDTTWLDAAAIAQRLQQGRKDLADLGVDDKTRDTLVSIAAAETVEPQTVRETLLALAPQRKPSDLPRRPSEQPTQAGKQVSTHRPSTRSMDLMGNSRARYKVEREHARGGMGRILLARDHVVGREVALKELLPHTGGSMPADHPVSQGLEERFLREAKITGQLEHPNIVPVYEIGKHPDGAIYYTMKFVRGETLARKLKRINNDSALDRKQKLAARLKLLDSFIDVCNAIAYAHNRGVIHRDIKPDNVMVGEYGETVVLDWGLARVKGQEDTAARQLLESTKHMSKSLVNADSENLTLHGSVVGTPAYMPPEQARGDLENVDEQSDVYALGAVLYEIIAGRAPFDGPVPGLIIQQVLHGTPIRAGAVVPEAPPELEALILHAMAREKGDRLGSARQLANELVAFRDGKTLASYQYTLREHIGRWVSRHKRAVILAMIAAYAVVAAGTYHYFQLREEKQMVEDQKLQADKARGVAELERENARREQQSATEARKIAETEEKSAQEARDKAEAAGKLAREEAAEKTRALQGWDRTLADAYAMRSRLAIKEKDFNAALVFAAAALDSAEQPEARGTLVSLPTVYPLVWELRPDTTAKQQIYQVFHTAVSPDGAILATGMPDGRTYVWDLTSGGVLARLGADGAAVMAVAFHPGGEQLATGDDSGNIRLYDVDPANRRISDPGKTFRCRARVNSLAFAADGRQLLCGSSSIEVWALATMRRVALLADPDHAAMDIAISPDGRLATSCNLEPKPGQNEVRLWDVAAGSLRTKLAGHALNATCAVFSPDGRTLASGSLDSTIRLWDLESETCTRVIAEHSSYVIGLAYAPDGRTLASCSADSSIRLWDTRSGECISVITGFEGWVQSVVFGPDGNTLAARSIEGKVRVWRLSDRDRRAFREHTADVFDVRFSADGNHLISASWDGTVRVRDTKTMETEIVFRGHVAPVWGADISPDNHTVASVGVDGTRIWDLRTGKAIGQIKPSELTVDARFSPDGKRLALSMWKRIFIFDAGTLQELAMCAGHTEITTECAWSPDGSQIISASVDGTLRKWDSATGQPLGVLYQGTGRLPTVTYSPDGKMIATGGEDRDVVLLDAQTGSVLRRMQGHEDSIYNVRFSPDGRTLFSSSGDRTIRVWDVASGNPIASMKAHSETVTRLGVHPQGAILASGSQDDTVRLWPLWVLGMPRQSVKDWAQLQTGLTVPDKQFAVRLLPTWPEGLRDDFDSHGTRREHVRGLARFSDLVQGQYEGWRCIESTDSAGQRTRHYLPARKRDANGRLQGQAEGKVHFAGWWEEKHADALKSSWEKNPIVTEVLAEGQARDLGLQVGDLIVKVDGREVKDREDLRLLLESLADKPEYDVEIVRLRRDEKGTPQARLNDAGDVLVNNAGFSFWDGSVVKVKLKPGKLGMRIGDALTPPRPSR